VPAEGTPQVVFKEVLKSAAYIGESSEKSHRDMLSRTHTDSVICSFFGYQKFIFPVGNARQSLS